MADNGSIDILLGDPKRALRGMMLPFIVSYMVVQINLLADTMWCAGLGAEASSAVSSMSPLIWIISDIGTGLGVGASVAIARAIGAGDKDRADRLCSQMVMLSLFVSILVTISMYLLLRPSIHLIGADDIEDGCVAYMMPMILLSVFIVLNGVFAGLIRAEGAARRVMILMLSVAVLNIVLDPILIYMLDMGVTGAGLATALSTVPAVIVSVYWYAVGRLNLHIDIHGYRPIPSDIRDLLYVGIPKISESMIINIMSFVQRVFVIICAGTVGVMVFNIPWRYVAIGIVPAIAICAAMVPICSAAMGCNDFSKAKVGFRYATKLALGISLPLTVFVFVFAEPLMVPFTLEESMRVIRPEFVETLRIYALIIPFWCMIELGSAIMQSLRKAQFAMVMSFLRNAMICVMFVFACRYDMTAISLSLLLAEIVGGLSMYGLAIHFVRRSSKDVIASSVDVQ